MDDPDRFFSLLTGDVSPEKRQEVWKEARLIFATPETVLNDLNSGRVHPSGTSSSWYSMKPTGASRTTPTRR